ncbi:unnamed protein product [Protopolystoma xenopodis]|uniref:PLAT domain-containing protein n=1 Tax=Protopolystoma xenopodis TaxID=117903 RepID=A0A3S5CT25_9PLAT|nr:unnamed protein product [Protopolystoma xenopodis]
MPVHTANLTNDAIMAAQVGWNVDSLIVDMPTIGKRITFPIHTWLAKDKLDGKTTRRFPVHENNVITYKPMIPYTLTIKTANVEGAGTDCTVYIQLFGLDGTSRELALEKMENRFERDSDDTIPIELEAVGHLRKIRIRHDGMGQRKDWRPEVVQIHDIQNLVLYHFQCDDWLSPTLGFRKMLHLDLPAIIDGVPQLSYKAYKIYVQTSNVLGAGTDAAVYIRLFGEYGDSGDLHLAKSSTHKDPFETNHVRKVFRISGLSFRIFTMLSHLIVN